MLKNSSDQYGVVSRFFHWVIALLILGLLCVGFGMHSLPPEPFKGTVYGIHKSTGMLVLMLAALRILWVAYAGRPVSLENHAFWEKALAKIVHILLYFGMIVMPVSGWIMSSAGEHPVTFYNLFTIPPIVAPNHDLGETAERIHGLAAYALIAAVLLHYAGAFKHHFLDRDETLRRMGGNHVIAVIGAILVLAPVAVLVVTSLNKPEKPPEQAEMAKDAAPEGLPDVAPVSDEVQK
ncbi:MAG: cytochrome b [Alphaproteobacteria bacterium]|nr:cytochrome b [Alphaproteobacteria bacterium]